MMLLQTERRKADLCSVVHCSSARRLRALRLFIAILVTNDGDSKRQTGGILGHREALARLGVSVMTDAEAVTYVRRKIAERDERMRLRAERDGARLPTWVGKD